MVQADHLDVRLSIAARIFGQERLEESRRFPVGSQAGFPVARDRAQVQERRAEKSPGVL